MNPRMRNRSARAAAALLALLALAACGGERGDRLSIATGNTTGVYYQMGGGLADLVTAHIHGYEATAETTSGSVENIERVSSGDSDIGFTLADTAAEAVQGNAPFDQPRPIRALMRIYTNYTQVAVRVEAGIDSVAGMRGKRVSVGSPNSGTEVIALRLLRAAGLNPGTDIAKQQLSLPESVQAMKDGATDALFWSGGIPTGGITDLTTSLSGHVRFLDLSDLLPALQRQYGPVYQEASIPRATYGLPTAVQTISVPNLLVVDESFSDELAYDLVKLIFDRKTDLERVHPEARNIQLEIASQTEPVALHQGARRYFDERARSSSSGNRHPSRRL